MKTPKPPRQRMFDAVYKNNLRELKVALAAGAQVNDQDEYGNTPLLLAVLFDPDGDTVLPALIDCGADLNSQDRRGHTPLHLAACCGDGLAHWRMLTDAGADLSITTPSGRTPLDYARISGDEKLVLYIRSREAERLRLQLEANTAPAYAQLPDLCDDNKHAKALATGQIARRRRMRL